MIAFLQTIVSALRAAPRGAFAHSRSLLESAGQRAGRNPRHARELRRAALAALRVVR
jgi:hypothetical protein